MSVASLENAKNKTPNLSNKISSVEKMSMNNFTYTLYHWYRKIKFENMSTSNFPIDNNTMTSGH